MAEGGLESPPGAGPATADGLVESGYGSYQSIAVVSPDEPSNKADIGSSTASDVISAAYGTADVGGSETGSVIPERRQQIDKLSQQIDEVDEPLGGGLKTQFIAGVYGGFGTGRSQITHQLAVNVQFPPEQSGLDDGCIFVDSENTLRLERIDDMTHGLKDEALETTLDNRKMEGSIDDEEAIKALVDDFLDKIHAVKALNSNHQTLLVEKAKGLVGEHEDTEWPVRLLCVDSLTIRLRVKYVGRGELAEYQQKLNKHLYNLVCIGDLFNTGIPVTNQVSSNPDLYFGDPTQPIGGNILSHISTFHIYLRKSKGDRHTVRLVDALNLADGEAIMCIQNAGPRPE